MRKGIHIISRLFAAVGLTVLGLSVPAWAVEEPANGLNQLIQGFQIEWRQPGSSLIEKSPFGLTKLNVNLSDIGGSLFYARGVFGEQMQESAGVRRPMDINLMNSPPAFSLWVDKVETKLPASRVGSKKSVLGKLFSKVEFFPNRFNVIRSNDPEGMVLFAF